MDIFPNTCEKYKMFAKWLHILFCEWINYANYFVLQKTKFLVNIFLSLINSQKACNYYHGNVFNHIWIISFNGKPLFDE